MTSSLVGSEMCIRDSYQKYHGRLFMFDGSSYPLSYHRNQWKTNLRVSEPVSYTHLTLPTICSV
eukprot:11411721-Prorocentrum_lima.AAC.1